MRIWKTENEEIVIERIPAQLLGWLREIPGVLESSGEIAAKRFFPPPSEDPLLKEICEDWVRYVHPELNEYFRRVREEVALDLKVLEESGGWVKLLIPMKHVEGWLSVLNQARFCLCEVWGFTDEEMSNSVVSDPRKQGRGLTERALARFQCDFYGILMEAILGLSE